MSRKLWFALPLRAGFALLVHRQVPGPRPDDTIVLPSGWRIHPAGRQVAVGTMPLGLITLGDGSLLVTNNGHGPNGLLRIDPQNGRVTDTLRLRAAWLGLARSGDPIFASRRPPTTLHPHVPPPVGCARDTPAPPHP